MNDTAPDAAPDCAPAQRIVRTPRERLPAGTCDCHLHVFGDRARYPLDARRSYTPHVATLEEHRAVMAACGIERAVLVQPSVYGTDNSCMLDALRDAAGEGDAYRGVAVPDAAASDEELLAMDALGVRGIRLNVVNPQVLAVDDGIALCTRMRSQGWHLQVHLMLARDGATTLARLADRVDVPIVVDHFGRPQAVSALPQLLLDLVDLLVATLPDATTLHRVCVDNPASLYGF